MSTASPQTNAPLQDLEEWDDFLEGRYKEGSPRKSSGSMTPRPTPASPSSIDSTTSIRPSIMCSGKEKQYFGLQQGEEDGLGSSRVSEYARGRQRSGHRSDPDRAPAADVRSDSPRRPSTMDGAGRVSSRSRQVSLPLRRATMGRGGRHVPGRLRVVEGHRVSRSTSRRIPTALCPSIRPNTGYTSPTAALRMCTCPSATTDTLPK